MGLDAYIADVSSWCAVRILVQDLRYIFLGIIDFLVTVLVLDFHCGYQNFFLLQSRSYTRKYLPNGHFITFRSKNRRKC